MAKQTLPVNFKDDILASSMDGKRRYHIIDNGDGTVSLEDVTEYTQTGSDFGAKEVNEEREAINELYINVGSLESLDTEAKTSLVKAVNEVDKNADDTASKLGFLVNADNILGNNFGKNFRGVSLPDKYAEINKNSYFSLPADRSGWRNVPETFPSGQVIGLREVIWRNSSYVMVKITEMFPRQGVEYYSFYNTNGWTPWIERNPSTGDILDSLSSVIANATTKKMAGALAVKEMYNIFQTKVIGGNFAYDDSKFTFAGSAICQFLPSNRLNIHMNLRCENANPPASYYTIFGLNDLKKGLGVSRIDFSPLNTRAYVYYPRESSITRTKAEDLGRLGLLVQKTNEDSFCLARAYDASMSIGGWGASKSELYKLHNYYHIDIYGASFT